jgi:hypothetical protein
VGDHVDTEILGYIGHTALKLGKEFGSQSLGLNEFVHKEGVVGGHTQDGIRVVARLWG